MLKLWEIFFWGHKNRARGEREKVRDVYHNFLNVSLIEKRILSGSGLKQATIETLYDDARGLKYSEFHHFSFYSLNLTS